MAKNLPMEFDQRKNYPYHSNFKTPISGLSKINSQTHQFSLMFLLDDQEKQKKNISSKETTAELKLVQEWRSMKTKNVGIEQSDPNIDGEFLENHPFLEEPVSFNFGDDYGNHLFLELQQEFTYKSENNGLSHGDRGIVVEGMKYSSDDIYILSPESGMIKLFLRDNLF